MKQRLISLVLCSLEIPLVLLVGVVAFLWVGLGSDYFISLGTSLLVGAVCCAGGIRLGRNMVLRAVQVDRWRAESAMIPGLLADQGEEMPDVVREAFQYKLREAQEGLARVQKQ